VRAGSIAESENPFSIIPTIAAKKRLGRDGRDGAEIVPSKKEVRSGVFFGAPE
jgi:hypothetical protein